MKDYTALQDKVKNIDQKNLGEVSPPLIPAPLDSSDNAKAIIDTVLRMIPGAVVLSTKSISGLAPDVKSHCVISRQRKQKNGMDKRQLKLDFGTSEHENIGGAK
jgi:hypothetical protein